MKELIKKLMSIKLLEFGKIIVPNVLSVSHNEANMIGVWWYNLDSHRLFYSDRYPHAYIEKFEGLGKYADVAPLMRGRLFQYEEDNYIAVYRYDFDERGIRLTGEVLADIVDAVEKRSGKQIDKIVDHEGHDLLADSR